MIIFFLIVFVKIHQMQVYEKYFHNEMLMFKLYNVLICVY